MKIRLTISREDKEVVNEQYGVNLDWNLLSYCLTTSYNWIVPNRKTHTNNIRVALKGKEDGCVGWFKYGQTLYIIPELNETLNDFVETLFHEFCHWNQYWIDDRSHVHMVTKRSNGQWGSTECEKEAQKWEVIGKNALVMYNMLKEGKELL